MRGAAFAVAMSLLPMAAAAQETRPGPLMPVQPGSISGLLGGGGHQPDPRRVSHRLDLTIDANSGRDENVRAEYFGIPVDPANPLLSGAAGSAAAMMNYRWGREGRAIEANGLAYGTRFDGYNNWPMGAGALRALTNVGRRSGLAADVAFSYQPSFLQQTENPDSDVAVPPIADSEQQQGVTRQRWLASNASVEGFRNFTNRHRVELRVSGQRRNLLLGAGLESRQAAAQTQYRFTASRAIQLLASYQFSDLRQRETERTYEPLATHAAEIGASFTQRVSATRQAQFTVTAGAARGSRAASTDTPAADFTVPTASGAVILRLSRSWSVAADVRRDVAPIDGVTTEPFTTSSGGLRLQMRQGRRLQFEAVGSLSRGAAQVSRRGEFEGAMGSATLRFALSPKIALFGSYFYYEHRLRDLASVPDGFPVTWDRRSLRGGVTMWLPVFGSF